MTPDLLVVIENDNHVLVQEACMVHGLICHASCDGSVSNDSNAMVLPPLHIRHCQPFATKQQEGR